MIKKEVKAGTGKGRDDEVYDIIKVGNLNRVDVRKASDGRDTITPIVVFTIGGEDDEEIDVELVNELYESLNKALQVPFIILPACVTMSVIESL